LFKINSFLKKILVTYSFLMLIISVFAQKQGNIWYFGTRVGVDFNRSPPSALYYGKGISQEGCAVISDNNGKLLFYTNGVSIINRKHLPMLNGDNLMGDLSSTDNAVFAQLPGNDSIYYLFTVGSAYQPDKGFRYNVINSRGDNSNGEVINKNIIIEPLAFEKLGAVRHCNNKDVWVVIHKWNSDEYHAYLITASGISNTPVISHTGFFINGTANNSVGTLKFSGNAKRAAAAHSYENNVIELMDFDNITGRFSNPIVFRPSPITTGPTFTGAYGAEFSPSGNLLYVSDNSSSDEPGSLFQFDITAGTVAAIVSSRQVIARPDPFFSGALQMGPDKKIYMALAGNSYLSAIENPDIYGSGCTFNYKEIFLGNVDPTPVTSGLPNFIQSYFNPSSNPYDFARLGKCYDHNVSFSINRLSGIDSVKWDFGDGNISQLNTPINYYVNPGFYNVKLIVYKIDCSGLNDTINHTVWITDKLDFLGKDTTTCKALQIQLGIEDIPGANYVWNTGSGLNKIVSSDPGTYWMEIEYNGCIIRDSVNLSLKAPPNVNIGPDTSVCRNKTVVLNAFNTPGSSYLWSTNETTSSILISNTGTYSVIVTENLCSASDTIVVKPGDCDIYIPNAFTPNNDSRNETFGVVDNATLQFFSMQIYNKWGQLIFSSNDITRKWDGTFKGKNMPNGNYVWILNYTNMRGRKFYDQGTVMLIR
jgi:gliding motility-associated-like protein